MRKGWESTNSTLHKIPPDINSEDALGFLFSPEISPPSPAPIFLVEIQPLRHDDKSSRLLLPRRFPVKRVLSLLIAVFVLTALAVRAADSTKINGWISDSMCGAKHAGSGAECVKKCIQSGMTPVFVDEAKKAVWTIDNPDAVKDFYGGHVTVTATTDAGKKSVHIEAISSAE
jgi:hypothetical protein